MEPQETALPSPPPINPLILTPVLVLGGYVISFTYWPETKAVYDIMTLYKGSLVSRLSPSSLFYTHNFIHAKLLCREKGGGEPGRL